MSAYSKEKSLFPLLVALLLFPGEAKRKPTELTGHNFTLHVHVINGRLLHLHIDVETISGYQLRSRRNFWQGISVPGSTKVISVTCQRSRVNPGFISSLWSGSEIQEISHHKFTNWKCTDSPPASDLLRELYNDSDWPEVQDAGANQQPRLPSLGSARYIWTAGQKQRTGNKIYCRLKLGDIGRSLCTPTCQDNYLDIGKPFIQRPRVQVKWANILRETLVVDRYILDLHRTLYDGKKLRIEEAPLDSRILGPSGTQGFFSLKEPGVYCVLLSTYDVRGNIYRARRCLVFDEYSDVTASETEPIKVLSAARHTDHKWLTDLEMPLYISWKGHFKNEHYLLFGWLAEIQSFRRHDPLLVEDKVGQPPAFRSMAAIPNIRGIVRYQIAVVLGKMAGVNGTMDKLPFYWRDVANISEHAFITRVGRQDGDTVRVDIKAYDVMNRTTTSSAYVHVDSSPAVLEDVTFMYKDYRGCDLRLGITVLDPHSGISKIHWRLQDFSNRTRTYEEQLIQVNKTSYCGIGCYRIPIGDVFERRFIGEPFHLTQSPGNAAFHYINITITNGAGITKSFILNITLNHVPKDYMINCHSLNDWEIGLIIVAALCLECVLLVLSKCTEKSKSNARQIKVAPIAERQKRTEEKDGDLMQSKPNAESKRKLKVNTSLGGNISAARKIRASNQSKKQTNEQLSESARFSKQEEKMKKQPSANGSEDDKTPEVLLNRKSQRTTVASIKTVYREARDSTKGGQELTRPQSGPSCGIEPGSFSMGPRPESSTSSRTGSGLSRNPSVASTRRVSIRSIHTPKHSFLGRTSLHSGPPQNATNVRETPHDMLNVSHGEI